jgi:predicted enzyme related to lactoylglutathione lyase
MSISQLGIVSIPVGDQDRSMEFYIGILGLTLIRDSPMGPSMRWVQIAPQGAATSIALVTWFPTMRPGSVKGLVLETDDLEGDVATLVSHGVTIADGIQEQPWGRFVTFEDPDGNGIVLQTTSISATNPLNSTDGR